MSTRNKPNDYAYLVVMVLFFWIGMALGFAAGQQHGFTSGVKSVQTTKGKS